MNAELSYMWSQVQAELAAAVDTATYRIWLEPLGAAELAGDTLTVTAPPHACAWVRERFGRLLQTAAAAVFGPELTIHLLSLGDPLPTADAAGCAPADAARAASDDSRLLANPKLTFEHFVIGDSNRLAHAAALTVAEMPSQAYNPLFICGPPGVGKTHLLHSIRALALSHDPTLAIRCLTGEQFTTEFRSALGHSHLDDFKARYRRIDMLLIDDVQFFERKTRTEEEFFHTFNALHDSGAQIVLTSDRPPADLSALEDRLRERFQAGLVADIHPPDRPTRLAILRKRAHHDNVQLADDSALPLIADRVALDVRALEGALIRVVAYSSLTRRPLTSALTAQVLDGLYPQQSPTSQPTPRTIAEIQAAACEHFGLTTEEILSTTRTRRVSYPRQIAMYLARELTGESLPAIGRQFGGRDHTTVLHAWRRTQKLLSCDESSRLAVQEIRTRLL